MAFRIEKDSLGEVKVPHDAYYGAQTARAIENFQISNKRLPYEFIRSYAMIKYAAAKANMSTARLDGKKGKAVLKACDEVMRGKHDNQFLIDVYQAGAGTSTNMNLNEVVANRATELLGGEKGQYIVHPNDDVNMAQSTNDTFHSATHVTAVLMIRNELNWAVKRLNDALEKKSKEFKSIVKAGRTHLQHAVPLTLGQEFSGYAAAVAKDLDRLERSISSLQELNLGGTAIGTGLNAEPRYIKQVYKELNRMSKQKFRLARNAFEATQNIGAVLETSSSLRHLAIDLIKTSSDFRLLASSDIDEIILPAAQPGSSIMPGKVNPSIPEMVGMVGLQVMGNDTVITNAVVQSQLELNVFMPVAAYNLLDSIKILTNACLKFSECISGARANEQRIKENLEKDAAIVTALAPHLGYQKAAEVFKEAKKTGRPAADIVVFLGYLTKSEAERLLDAKNLTKPGVPKKGK